MPKDSSIAVRHFAEAIKFKDPIAFVHIGYAFANGNGVAKNLEQAFLYFEAASNLGNSTGWACLGLCYQHGIGTPVSLPEAVEYMTMSAQDLNSFGQVVSHR